MSQCRSRVAATGRSLLVWVILVFQEDLEEGEIAVLSSSHDGSGGYGPTSLLEEAPYLLKMVLPR